MTGQGGGRLPCPPSVSPLAAAWIWWLPLFCTILNILKFIILGYLTARNLGFWTDTDIIANFAKDFLNQQDRQ